MSPLLENRWMITDSVIPLQITTCELIGSLLRNSSSSLALHNTINVKVKPLLVVQAKANTRTDSPKIQNRRFRKKFNGTQTKPRLSVFCSDEQLYALLVDDQNKKCLFYGSTLQKSIRTDLPCTTMEAAERLGEELIKTCIDLGISEISSYDRNGFAVGGRIQAFEIAVSRHGFMSE